MELTSVVLYQDKMVYYRIISADGHTFRAKLIKYKDHPVPPPPGEIDLRRDGKRWSGNADHDLVKFLGFDIENQLKLKTGKSRAI